MCGIFNEYHIYIDFKQDCHLLQDISTWSMLILSGSGRTDLVCFVFRSRTLSASLSFGVHIFNTAARCRAEHCGAKVLALCFCLCRPYQALHREALGETHRNSEYSYHNVRGPLNACRTHTPIRRTRISEYRIVLDRIGSWMLR